MVDERTRLWEQYNLQMNRLRVGFTLLEVKRTRLDFVSDCGSLRFE